MPVANRGSGVTRYILENWRFLADEFVFDFATRSPALDFAEEALAKGGRLHRLSGTSGENEERFIWEMEAILDSGYAAVHLHTSFWSGFLAERLARERGTPVIAVHAHSTMADLEDPGEREAAVRLHERLKREFTPELATHFCACSAAAAAWLFGPQIDRGRIRILKNAVDLDKFAFNPGVRERVRKELGLGDSPVLGYAGRFSYQKNPEMLLEIFRLVQIRNPRARLLLAGDGPRLEPVRRLAGELSLTGKALFLGRRGDVAELLQAMDVFLLPSRFEGLGLALVEAQAAGLRCLASERVPVEAKLTPLLTFLPLDPGVWAEAALEPDSGRDRREGAALVAEAGYSLQEAAKILARLYRGELS
ncbi:MAG: glycosyltransferase [Planctomycetota bacterium]|jgi:glycosyltransferase involved in cell wall biosynthesis|nr:glycosyltransferase [Planctomycetota bacterium]